MANTPLFITGRFRSGTSFLWQLFNQLEGFCAWYEPLHPQLLAAIEHVQPKSDHVGIDDYWHNYRKHPDFSRVYRPQFAVEHLYLEESDCYTELEEYINKLIELSGDDVPVIQFNRVDLRLSWLKAKFPNAKIIHIKRNPLQLYHSQRKHIPKAKRDDPNYWDAYELPAWCHALNDTLATHSTHQHAFYGFYLLYQLSELMAKNHADVSINLDQHIFQSDEFIEQLSAVVPLSQNQIATLKHLVHVPNLPEFEVELTEQLAAIMTEVDVLLMQSGLYEGFAVKPLAQIKSQHQDFWSNQTQKSHQSTQHLLTVINELQTEMTRILAENNRLKSQVNDLTAVVAENKPIESSEVDE